MVGLPLGRYGSTALTARTLPTPMTHSDTAEAVKRTFVIACCSLDGTFRPNQNLNRIISEKLAQGYEIVLQPIVQPKNLKGKMYDSMFIEEAWNDEALSFT